MKFLLNIVLAWIATILLFVLGGIWILRIMKSKSSNEAYKDKIGLMHKRLRSNHEFLGYVFIAASFFHGMFSSFSIFSFNIGTVSLMVGVLIIVTFNERVSLKSKWIAYHRQLTIALVVTLIIHIVEVGGLVGINGLKSRIELGKVEKNEFNAVKTNAKYKDGIYEGEGTGYNPGLRVSVEIRNGEIYSVDIIGHNEVGERFYGSAFEKIPREIVDKQSPDVDIVTGATYSSLGIMDAVKDALKEAENN